MMLVSLLDIELSICVTETFSHLSRVRLPDQREPQTWHAWYTGESMQCFTALDAHEIVLTKRPETKDCQKLRHTLVNPMRLLKTQTRASVLARYR